MKKNIFTNKRNYILLQIVVLLFAVVYLVFCLTQGDKKFDIKDVAILGGYAFMFSWAFFSYQQKVEKEKLEKQMYQDKNMELYVKYYENKCKKSSDIKHIELYTVQMAIGYAYNGELVKAEKCIKSLKKNGDFSVFIRSNAIINLYIIYLYQGELQKAQNVYQQYKEVFAQAVSKKEGFTHILWQAYELVLQRKYKSAKKRLLSMQEHVAQRNDVYKMLMSEILLEIGSPEQAKKYMEECLNTVMFPFMKQRIEVLYDNINKRTNLY